MSAAAHGRDATSNGVRQPKRAEVARLKSAIANALTGLTAGETTGAQLRGLVSQVVNGGGIYKLLIELGVPVSECAEALAPESAAEGAISLFNDLGIVRVAHLPAGGCGCLIGTNHMKIANFCLAEKFFTNEGGATVCSSCGVSRSERHATGPPKSWN